MQVLQMTGSSIKKTSMEVYRGAGKPEESRMHFNAKMQFEASATENSLGVMVGNMPTLDLIQSLKNKFIGSTKCKQDFHSCSNIRKKVKRSESFGYIT